MKPRYCAFCGAPVEVVRHVVPGFLYELICIAPDCEKIFVVVDDRVKLPTAKPVKDIPNRLQAHQ